MEPRLPTMPARLPAAPPPAAAEAAAAGRAMRERPAGRQRAPWRAPPHCMPPRRARHPRPMTRQAPASPARPARANSTPARTLGGWPFFTFFGGTDRRPPDHDRRLRLPCGSDNSLLTARRQASERARAARRRRRPLGHQLTIQGFQAAGTGSQRLLSLAKPFGEVCQEVWMRWSA